MLYLRTVLYTKCNQQLISQLLVFAFALPCSVTAAYTFSINFTQTYSLIHNGLVCEARVIDGKNTFWSLK